MINYREKIAELIKGRSVLILGFGREGKSTYEKFIEIGGYAKLAVADANEALWIPQDAPDVAVYAGKDYQKAIFNYDLIMKSPGIVLEKEVLSELPRITSQAELMLEWYRDRIIGITGTKGKSTTTTLIYHTLKEHGKNAVLMGNIGIPAFDCLDDIKDDSIIVFEFSCHQLEYVKVSPHIAVYLNLYEEHLDHYGTFEKYKEAKENIYRFQTEDDKLFCGPDVAPNSKDCKSLVKICCITDKTSELSNYTTLLGKHNLFDISLVYRVTKEFDIHFDTFKESLRTYKPLPHRLEFVGEVGGVKYYDDSISTISETTIQALNTLPDVDCVIVGGMDRGIDYTPLEEYLQTKPVNHIILMYETGERIAGEIEQRYHSLFKEGRIHVVPDLPTAVVFAKKHAKKGKSVVMSPAAASYGYFRNFEDRGEVFKTLVLSDKK